MLKKGDNIWFWEEGYHGEEIYSNIFFDSKLNYIHHNPVRAGFVEKAEDYFIAVVDEKTGEKGLWILYLLKEFKNTFICT
jgi:hypothetical protein